MLVTLNSINSGKVIIEYISKYVINRQGVLVIDLLSIHLMCVIDE